MKGWREYFKHLLDLATSLTNTQVAYHMTQIERIENQSDTIEADEFQGTVKTTKNSNTAGHDRLTTEMAKKNMEPEGIKMLLRFTNEVWKRRKYNTVFKIIHLP